MFPVRCGPREGFRGSSEVGLFSFVWSFLPGRCRFSLGDSFFVGFESCVINVCSI